MHRIATAMLFAALLAAPAAIADPPSQPQQQDQQHHAAKNRTVRPVAYPTRHVEKNVTIRTERFNGTRDYVTGRRPPNWNNRPRIIDRRIYHHNFTAAHRFRWRPYIRPHGWYYRRWVFGDRLPSIFWTRNYWITEYWLFGLPVPPLGCEWVRYGHDALLIDSSTGEILQVIYGIFY